MCTSRHRIFARRSRQIGILMALFTILLLSGCGAAKQELTAAQTELSQAQDQLAGAQTEISARQTEVAGLRQQIATAEAQIGAQQAKNESLSQELADVQAQVQAKETALADAQKQIAATEAELDDVKFAAERLLAQAEIALQKEDLKEAQRIADLLAEKHPGAAEVARAEAIVGLIEKALAEKAAAEQARLAAATGKMRSETDAVRGITFYSDKTTTEYNDVNSFHLYIGKNESRIWLRLRIQYTADDWLFIENYVIKADDQRFDIAPDYFAIERDNAYGAIWEWYDGAVERKDIRMVQAIIASKNTTLRYNGKQYYVDREITAAEKQALQNVLDAFVALGGDLENP